MDEVFPLRTEEGAEGGRGGGTRMPFFLGRGGAADPADEEPGLLGGGTGGRAGTPGGM